jgi:tetratricopeptide (TPR) repeat protein
MVHSDHGYTPVTQEQPDAAAVQGGITMRHLMLALIALLAFTATARAEWLEASSDHFVIYGDQSEKAIREFANRLERFHSGMSVFLRKPQTKPSPSNRVTVYVVTNEAKVRQVVGTNDRYLAGVYLPRAGASIAIVPKLRGARSQYDMSGETILYHEYAHHFMWTLTARTFPRWFIEGFAEYFASVKFKSDGSIVFGVPATHRAAELYYSRDVPIRTLLEFDGGAGEKKKGHDSFYGQSWVLFHYLQTAPERAGQLQKYQQLLASGDTALEAAEGAFGDLDQLEKDMLSYIERSKVTTFVVNAHALKTGTVNVRPLRAGEAEMMPVVLQSKAGVTQAEAVALLPEARRIAAKHPSDPAVLAALAEAEFDADNDDEAISAAERALAIDPQQMNAYLQKGYALTRKVQDAKLPYSAWKDVRSWWVKANKVENDHPIPLVQYYLSFVEPGEKPTKASIDGLEWAMQLAPFDSRVRWLVANQMILDDRYADAAQVLAPLAYSPHPGEHTERARRLLEEVEAKAQGGAAPPEQSPSAG